MLKKTLLKLSSWLAVVPVLLFPVSVANAFTAGLAGNQANTTLISGKTAGVGTQDLPVLIGNGINILLGALGVILVVVIIYAGVMYMTAGGEDEKVKKAKKMIMQSVIGMILIIAAYSISSFVIAQLTTVTNA